MSVRNSPAGEIPFLLPGKIVDVPGRGEMFVRHHQHSDSSVPTLLLLHGWTASCDSQFFAAYEELSQHFSIIGVDHRGRLRQPHAGAASGHREPRLHHGRGHSHLHAGGAHFPAGSADFVDAMGLED